MRRFAVVAVIAGTTQLAAACLVATGGNPDPYPYEAVQLDNGFRAYLVKPEWRTPGQIAYMSFVRTGSRDEAEPGRTGFAHFFEHLMSHGTAKYPDYAAATKKLDARSEAVTRPDFTGYYLTAKAEHLEKIIDLESDRFINLKYSASDFKKTVAAILTEYRDASPPDSMHWLEERVRETAFEKHTYRHTMFGFGPDIKAMPQAYAYSQSFYQRSYRPENVVLVISGGFDTALAKRLLGKYYGAWTAGYSPPAIEPEPLQTVAREKTVEYPPQYAGKMLPMISISYKAPRWDPTDRTAVALESLLNETFGIEWPLDRKLVLKEGRAQAIIPSFELSRDPSLVSFVVILSNSADAAAVEAEIMTEVRGLSEKTFDPQWVNDVSIRRGNRSFAPFVPNRSTYSGLPQAIAATGRLESMKDYARTLSSLTPQDYHDAAAKYLVDSGRTTIRMMPR